MNLHNESLLVDIPEPGSAYSRSRFDWSGIVRQVTLDGKHTFCSKEASPGNPGTEGIGLIHEFGIQTPIGYDETDVGKWFPKLGIGFLRRDNTGPYNFFKDYELDPVKIDCLREDDSSLVFTQNAEARNGYGWILQRRLILKGSSLLFRNTLENTGTKNFETEEYCHNFLRFNNHEVGPRYKVRLHRSITLIQADSIELQNSNVVVPTETPETYFYGKTAEFRELQEHSWSLECAESEQSLHVREEFPVSQFAIWGMKHVISPEFFLKIKLSPGEKVNWDRHYTFGC